MKSIILSALLLTGADKPLPVAQSNSKWTVDFGDNRCLAARGYLVEGEEVAFGLQPRPTTEGMRIFIQTKRSLEGLDSERASISIGSEKIDVGEMFVEPVVRKGYVRYGTWLNAEQLEKLTQTGRISIESRRLKMSFQLTQISSIRKLLDDCVAGLLVKWGLSLEAQKALATYPGGKNVVKVFNANDYPTAAIRGGEIGAVEVIVNTDTAGNPTDCRVIQSSGHEALDTQTCAILKKRAHFEPARDHAGNAMAGPALLIIRWLLP